MKLILQAEKRGCGPAVRAGGSVTMLGFLSQDLQAVLGLRLSLREP